MLAPLIALVLVAAAPPAADARPPLVHLRWDAPAECPDAAAIEDGVRRNLPPAMTVSTPLDVDARVEPTSPDAAAPTEMAPVAAWQATLVITTATGIAERVLAGGSCRAVADAATLVISMALSAAAQPPPPPPVVVPAPAPAPPEGGPSSEPFLSTSALLDRGALPGLTAGAALALGWRWPRAWLAVEGALYRARSADAAVDATVGARFDFSSLTARACRAFTRGAWSLSPCLDAGLTRTTGDGFGLIHVGHAETTSVALGGGLWLHWAASRHIVPFVRVGAEVPLLRPRFSVEDVGEVFRAAPVLLRGGLGLELRFR
jgi:hypothetical protein